MNIYETDIMRLLNENEEINNTGIVVMEVDFPEPVGLLDKAKYQSIFKDANDIITGQGQKKEPTEIASLILEVLKITIKYLAKVPIKIASRQLIPDSMKIKFVVGKNGDKPFAIQLNPIAFMIDFITNALLDKLFEIAVAPIKVKYMVKSYREMIDRLEDIKKSCKGTDIEKKCDIQIRRINTAIKELESKLVKEDSEMKTVKDIMTDVTESIDVSMNLYDDDDVISMVQEAQMECDDEDTIFEADMDFIVDEGCGKRSKTESYDEDDDEDIDIDDEDIDESYLMSGFEDESEYDLF